MIDIRPGTLLGGGDYHSYIYVVVRTYRVEAETYSNQYDVLVLSSGSALGKPGYLQPGELSTGCFVTENTTHMRELDISPLPPEYIEIIRQYGVRQNERIFEMQRQLTEVQNRFISEPNSSGERKLTIGEL